MVKENRKYPNERMERLKSRNNKVFAFAYVELRDAVSYAKKYFNGFPVHYGLKQAKTSYSQRYEDLPEEIEEQAEKYSSIYKTFHERDIARSERLQSRDDEVFLEAFLELQSDITDLENEFPNSPFQSILEEKTKYCYDNIIKKSTRLLSRLKQKQLKHSK